MAQIRKLARETFVYGIGSILPKVLNFLLLAPYLTRILNQESYGIYGILYAYIALFITIFTFRLETAFFRFTTKGEDPVKTYSTAIWMIILSSVILVSVILLNARPIAGFVTVPEDARFIRWFAFILAFDAVAAIPFAKLRLENKAMKFAGIKILNVLITAILIVFFLSVAPILVNKGHSLPFYDPSKELDYVFLSNLVASGLILVLLIKELLQVRFSLDTKLLGNMLKYSWPLILVGIAAAINQVFDRVFISKLLPGTPEANTAQSGIYNGAAKVAVLMSLFATAFNYAAEPFFFKMHKENNATDIYSSVALAYTIAAGFVFLGISLFSDLAQFLIGADFRAGMEIVPILLFAYLFLGLYYNFSIWYKLDDKTRFGAIIALSGALVTIAMNFILIPEIGYTGAAWSVLICYTVMCMLALIFGQKYYPIPYPLKKIAAYILLALILYFIHTQIPETLSVYLTYLLNSALLLIYFFTAWKVDKEVWSF